MQPVEGVPEDVPRAGGGVPAGRQEQGRPRVHAESTYEYDLQKYLVLPNSTE